jgi:hypothetical protein
MNGKERNISQFRKLSAYIMQDNQLHANLTVEEAMNVAANLKLSQKVDKTEKYHVVSISIFIFCMSELLFFAYFEWSNSPKIISHICTTLTKCY